MMSFINNPKTKNIFQLLIIWQQLWPKHLFDNDLYKKTEVNKQILASSEYLLVLMSNIKRSTMTFIQIRFQKLKHKNFILKV